MKKGLLHHELAAPSFYAMSDSVPRPDEEIVNLVRLAKSGDQKAFSALYERYVAPIYRYIFVRVRRREEAEDIAQAVFVKVWRAMPRFEERGSPFSAFLYKAAKNAVIDFWKRKKESFLDDRDEAALQIEDEGSDANRDLERRQWRARLLTAIGALSEDQQEIVLLKFIEDLSNREIAEITGKSGEAIRAIQCRALKALRTRFKKQDFI